MAINRNSDRWSIFWSKIEILTEGRNFDIKAKF